MPETTVTWKVGALALVMLGGAACGSAETTPRSAASPAHGAAKPETLEMLAPLDVLQRLRGGEEDRRVCFESSGQPSPGFVKLAWRVRADGRVDDVGVVGTSVHDAAFARWLGEKVGTLDFCPRQSGLGARWTFVHVVP